MKATKLRRRKKLTGWKIGENRGEHFRELITGTGILLIFINNINILININTHTHTHYDVYAFRNTGKI